MATAAFQAVVFLVVEALLLFGPAQRLDWPMAWIFLLVNVAFTVVGLLLVPADLIKERNRLISGARPEELLIGGLAAIFIMPATWIVCGLDFRFGWSPPIPVAVRLTALVLFIAGYSVALWAARTNRFFSTVVRIQRERGHHLVDTGPYAFVRHPGYGSWIIAQLTLPIMLGTLWGLVPTALGVVFMVMRASYEESTLADELTGYREYMRRVPWRFVPGIW